MQAKRERERDKVPYHHIPFHSIQGSRMEEKGKISIENYEKRGRNTYFLMSNNSKLSPVHKLCGHNKMNCPFFFSSISFIRYFMNFWLRAGNKSSGEWWCIMAAESSTMDLCIFQGKTAQNWKKKIIERWIINVVVFERISFNGTHWWLDVLIGSVSSLWPLMSFYWSVSWCTNQSVRHISLIGVKLHFQAPIRALVCFYQRDQFQLWMCDRGVTTKTCSWHKLRGAHTFFHLPVFSKDPFNCKLFSFPPNKIVFHWG